MEIWKSISGFEGRYEASTYGNIRRVYRRSPQVMRPSTAHHGYQRITLNSHRPDQKYCFVHRLVYEAFIGPIQNGLQMNHKNGNTMDNRLENLEAVTQSENMLHSYRVLGRIHPRGACVLKREQVSEIRHIHKAHSRTLGSSALARRFGVSKGTICGIVNGERYTHFTDPGWMPTPRFFSSEEVRQIRAMYIKNSRMFGSDAIARRYGVDQSTIFKILTRESYGHI